jgi:DNA-binding MarR family transcriptional regulator
MSSTDATTVPSPLEAILLLARTRGDVVREIDHAVSGHGIGFSDFVLMRALAGAPGGRMRRSELASALGVTPSGVARQVRPLERMGLIDRESNPRDARLALVVLTDTGARVLEETTTSAEQRANLTVERIWDERELTQLVELLGRAGR